MGAMRDHFFSVGLPTLTWAREPSNNSLGLVRCACTTVVILPSTAAYILAGLIAWAQYYGLGNCIIHPAYSMDLWTYFQLTLHWSPTDFCTYLLLRTWWLLLADWTDVPSDYGSQGMTLDGLGLHATYTTAGSLVTGHRPLITSAA